MWPWGHLAVGYLCYSVASRLAFDESPRAWPVVVLAVATQFPDLVDKPLSWSLDVFATGYGAGHSVFVAAPVIAVAGWLAHRTGRERFGLAFGVGYASHLAADVLMAVVLAKDVVYARVLWPVADLQEYAVERGFVGRFSEYVEEFAAELLAGEASFYVLLYVVLFATVLVVWVADGLPVAREATRWLSARARPGERR